MRINIAVYNWLDGIANAHGIKDVPWAEASLIRRPTISELRRIARNPKQKFGRACTIDKVHLLFIGLTKLIGEETMRKDILGCIEKEPDQDVRFMLYSLILKEATKEARDTVEKTMQLAARTITKKP